MRQYSMDNHLRRVLISFGLDFLIYMENPNVMMHLRSSQWKVCPLCLHAAKKPHKTSRAPSRSKKCKQRMTCCLPTHTRRVRYYYRTCPVWLRQQTSKQLFATMLKPGGDQVMSQPQYLMILITYVSWPRKARRRLTRKNKSRRLHKWMIKKRVILKLRIITLLII